MVPKPNGSMIGGHYVPGGEFLLPIMEEMSNAGYPMPFMLLMRQKYTSELTPAAVKSRSSKTKICQRWFWEDTWHDAPVPNWDTPDLYQAGYDFCNAYFDRLPVSSEAADWHQIINEPPGTGLGTATWFMGAMDAAYNRGYRIAILCMPNTWPALPGEKELQNGQVVTKKDDQFWLRASTIAMVRQCKKQGHLILTHEYIIPDPTTDASLWVSGYGMGRYERALALLPADCQDVMWALGEWGTGVGSTIGGDLMKSLWKACDDAFHRTKANLIGIAAWVWGPWNEQGRPSSDIGYHRQDAHDYWLTYRFQSLLVRAIRALLPF